MEKKAEITCPKGSSGILWQSPHQFCNYSIKLQIDMQAAAESLTLKFQTSSSGHGIISSVLYKGSHKF